MCFLRSSIDRINYLSFLENGHQLWNVQVHWNLRQTSLCLTCAYLERKLIYYSPADTDYSSHVIIKKYNFEKKMKTNVVSNRTLNPSFPQNVIPVYGTKTCALTFTKSTKNHVNLFISNYANYKNTPFNFAFHIHNNLTTTTSCIFSLHL